MLEQFIKTISAVIFLIAILLYLAYNKSKRDFISSGGGEFWIGPKEVGFVLEKGKIKKIIPSNSSYTSNSNNFKIFHLANRNLVIRKYKFRTSDYNSVALEINLELKIQDLEKAFLSTQTRVRYYNYNFELDILVVNKLVEEIRNIVFTYKRKELFDKYREISEIVKSKLSSQLAMDTGFEVVDVKIFETR